MNKNEFERKLKYDKFKFYIALRNAIISINAEEEAEFNYFQIFFDWFLN